MGHKIAFAQLPEVDTVALMVEKCVAQSHRSQAQVLFLPGIFLCITAEVTHFHAVVSLALHKSLPSSL